MRRLTCAVQVCGLIPICCDLVQDASLYVDRVPDAMGEHRVYVRDESTLPGLPWSYFRGLEDAVTWMTDLTRTPEEVVIPDRELDSWERGPTSAGWLLEQILEGLSDGGPSQTDAAELQLDWDDRTAGWERRLCLRLLQTGHVELPGSFDRSLLGPEHQAFVDHVRDRSGRPRPP